MISLADRLLKVIAGHEWGWQEDRPDGKVIGLICGCGWATSATDQALDRWTRHRDRSVREAIAEHEAGDALEQAIGGGQ